MGPLRQLPTKPSFSDVLGHPVLHTEKPGLMTGGLANKMHLMQEMRSPCEQIVHKNVGGLENCRTLLCYYDVLVNSEKQLLLVKTFMAQRRTAETIREQTRREPSNNTREQTNVGSFFHNVCKA